jgi:Fe-S cluster assembly scaffold protein SufB
MLYTEAHMQQYICNNEHETVDLYLQNNDVQYIAIPTSAVCTVVHINAEVVHNAHAHLIIHCANTGAVRIEQKNTINAHAQLHTHIVTLGSGITNHELRSTVTSEHATSNVHWLFYAKNTEKYTLKATNHFLARNGGGQMFLQGIAEQKAVVDVYGMINIGLQGGGTDTYLTEDVLMLDATSIVHAIPGLEIKTNDVKASHSATVRKITDADLFYFGSRGITKEQARSMFIRGYLENMLEPMPSEAKNLVQIDIETKLANS